MEQKVETEIAGHNISLSSGRFAKQANGSVIVRYGDTVVLATAVIAKEPKEDIDFFPLTIDYREKTYSAGKIPGGFFKREGRPSEKEILTSRLIDRPIRPLFPDGFSNETQVICTVLSVDQDNDPDILALIGASAALTISDIPFLGPIGAARIGMIDGEIVFNPTIQDMEASDLNLVMAAAKDGIVMVECGATELKEEVIVDALMFGYKEIKKIISLQEDLAALAGKQKITVSVPERDENLYKIVENLSFSKIKEAFKERGKLEVNKRLKQVESDVIVSCLDGCGEEDKTRIEKAARSFFSDVEKKVVRKMICEDNVRPDGRSFDEIRPVSCSVGVLPRTHGSALFTRGETQALVVSTLGTSVDEQMVDSLTGKISKSFMLHYNFPPFSVGEVGFLRGPGRREIGHGALAERAMLPVIPSSEKFPYTIRIVSDILESNGSSSMATVCGSSLSLMDAGVPIKKSVAGIAMGLIKEGDTFAILSDIQGTEDHLGDMDFKVAGTAEGITALQMDIKINGVNRDVLEAAMIQAKKGRLWILEKMGEAIEQPRTDLSKYAPRIISMKIHSDKVRDVIGSGGKVIKGIIEKTGVNIDIDDNGLISISSQDEVSAQKAVEIIKNITQDAEIGKIYLGKVKKITSFGAFVEIFPGTDGLLHISEIANHRVANVADELTEGEEITVKVKDIDRIGKIKLSRKDVLAEKKRQN